MAKLNIPERYRAGVSAIRNLDDASVRAIKAALKQAGPQKPDDLARVGRTPSDMAVTAVESVLDVPNLNLIGPALAALYDVRSSREGSVEEFADQVSDALESIPEADLRLPHAERAKFKENLIALLSADFFTVVFKLRDLEIEHERTFCTARIVTDLRPVFGVNVEDGPKAMLLVHNLRLAYHKGNEKAQDFYVSLDSDDLRMLRQLIDRAEAKARALETSSKNDLPIIGLPKES